MGAAEFKPSAIEGVEAQLVNRWHVGRGAPGLNIDSPRFTPNSFEVPSYQPAQQQAVPPQVMNANANSFYPSSQNQQQPPPPQFPSYTAPQFKTTVNLNY